MVMMYEQNKDIGVIRNYSDLTGLSNGLQHLLDDDDVCFLLVCLQVSPDEPIFIFHLNGAGVLPCYDLVNC